MNMTNLMMIPVVVFMLVVLVAAVLTIGRKENIWAAVKIFDEGRLKMALSSLLVAVVVATVFVVLTRHLPLKIYSPVLWLIRNLLTDNQPAESSDVVKMVFWVYISCFSLVITLNLPGWCLVDSYKDNVKAQKGWGSYSEVINFSSIMFPLLALFYIARVAIRILAYKRELKRLTVLGNLDVQNGALIHAGICVFFYCLPLMLAVQCYLFWEIIKIACF